MTMWFNVGAMVLLADLLQFLSDTVLVCYHQMSGQA